MKRKAKQHSICLLVLILGLACSDPAPGAHMRAIEDSAGVEIVREHVPGRGAAIWHVSQTPLLEVGTGATGDTALQFGHIAGIHRMSDGTIAVLDSWARGIAYFDSLGRPIGRAGRHGSGPGEFPGRVPLSSFGCGTDTVRVVAQNRVSAFLPPDSFVSTSSLERTTRLRACAGSFLIGQVRHGSRRTEPGTYTDSVTLLKFNLLGQFESEFATVAVEEREYAHSPEGGFGYARAPFGSSLKIAAEDSIVATGLGRQFEVEFRDITGAVYRVLRVEEQPRLVSGADIARFRDYVFNPRRGNETERSRLDAQLDAAVGKPLPAFAELQFDQLGNLWVRRYDHLDAVQFYDYSAGARAQPPLLHAPRQWVVFDSSGYYLAHVETPPGFIMHDIGPDWLLGEWRDDLGVQYVRLYALNRSAQQSN